MDKPIEVTLINMGNQDPDVLATHSAGTCYQEETPALGPIMDVEKRLFLTSHHTTIEHSYFTFAINHIAVGDITFGLHLASPFYNSDQRSGRFCSGMFANPDYGIIVGNYIKSFWPEISEIGFTEAMAYVYKGVGIYQQYLKKATDIASDFLKQERPLASEKYIETNAPKIAQEQLRMFVPVIFPSGLNKTVDLIALASLYYAAWTPTMKYVTAEMVRLVLEIYPQLNYIFNLKQIKQTEWWAKIQACNHEIKSKPSLREVNFDFWYFIVPSTPTDMHPIDLLHFRPEYMDNNVGSIKSTVEISVATMGQDQRHRTIRRSEPIFTGNFYLPAIPEACGLKELAKEQLTAWKQLADVVPKTLWMILAPYGAMVQYSKNGSLNAVTHEQAKRLCWCAQEEIYNLGVQLRNHINEPNILLREQVEKIFEPPCYRTGKCAEGSRYCGRNIEVRKDNFFEYFKERMV